MSSHTISCRYPLESLMRQNIFAIFWIISVGNASPSTLGCIPSLRVTFLSRVLTPVFFYCIFPIAFVKLSEGGIYLTPFQRRIQKTMDALYRLGPMLPGSISTQWNVCGKAGCRCKDPVRPQKHGPYYQLSFTLAGKSSTMFIKPDDLSTVRTCIKRYKQFKKLNNALVNDWILWARNGGLQQERKEKQWAVTCQHNREKKSKAG